MSGQETGGGVVGQEDGCGAGASGVQRVRVCVKPLGVPTQPSVLWLEFSSWLCIFHFVCFSQPQSVLSGFVCFCFTSSMCSTSRGRRRQYDEELSPRTGLTHETSINYCEETSSSLFLLIHVTGVCWSLVNTVNTQIDLLLSITVHTQIHTPFILPPRGKLQSPVSLDVRVFGQWEEMSIQRKPT